MASASSTSAKNLFVDSKRRLGERVHVNVNNMASICRQVLRGSQSADLLTKAARNMALQDGVIENTCDNAQKLSVLVTHLTYQQEAIERSVSALPEIKEQGGAEALFGNVRQRTVDLNDISCVTDDCKITDGANRTDESKSTDSRVWTLRRLLVWLKKDSGFLTGNEELFFSGDSIRNGVMVLVNDVDWELLGELDYQLEPDDSVTFISTLHGG